MAILTSLPGTQFQAAFSRQRAGCPGGQYTPAAAAPCDQERRLSVQVFAKAEWFNPGGSIKDRPALNILRNAIAEGHLTPGKRLLDSTSGNMGIAYATFGAALGIPVTLAVPANASPERFTILRALGAELILTDPLEGSDGALRVARQMAAEQPERYFYANQYDNPANWQAHYLSTGPEIVQQTGGRITHFIAGLGTSGTLTGVARYLRQYNPDVQIIALQPDSPFHGLEGLKHMPSAIQPGIYDPSPGRPCPGNAHRESPRHGAPVWRVRKVCLWAFLLAQPQPPRFK